MKPTDRLPAWPSQSVVIRLQCACMLLREILPDDLYTQVRKEVFDWDVKHDPNEAKSAQMRAAVNARWAKRAAN